MAASRAGICIVIASALIFGLVTLGPLWHSGTAHVSDGGVLPAWLRHGLRYGRREHDLASQLTDPNVIVGGTDVPGLASDILLRLGWDTSMQFARFVSWAGVDDIMSGPAGEVPAYVVIIPGNGTLQRRQPSQLLFSVDPNIPASSLSTAGVGAALAVLEKGLGRPLFPMRLSTAPFPACEGGRGPCVLWVVTTGRVWVHIGLLQRMAGTTGLADLTAAFASKLVELLDVGTGVVRSVEGLASRVAATGAVALTSLLLLPAPPLWFCIACPLVLGMAAPWIFNLGLTAAAQALCQHLALPDDECVDLWWGAFVLALILSLTSAIPIVYICRLPQCGRSSA